MESATDRNKHSATDSNKQARKEIEPYKQASIVDTNKQASSFLSKCYWYKLSN